MGWLRDLQSAYSQITFISIVRRVCEGSDRYFPSSLPPWLRLSLFHDTLFGFVESITPRKLYADFSLALIGIKASAGGVTQRANLSYFPRERHAAPARVTTMITGMSVSAWKFSLGDYGSAYPTHNRNTGNYFTLVSTILLFSI